MAAVQSFKPLLQLGVPAAELDFCAIVQDKRVTLLRPCGDLVGCNDSNPVEWDDHATDPLEDAPSHGLEDALDQQEAHHDDTQATGGKPLVLIWPG